MNKVICLSLLISSSTLAVTPYYSIRSQSTNAARELVGAGWNNFINRCHMDDWYGNFSMTPEYTRSFRSTDIGHALFGYCGNRCCVPDRFACYTPCCSPYIPLEGPCCEPGSPCCGPCCFTCCDDDFTVIHVAGSQALNRMNWDWLADYFGLPTDYKSCVTFEPYIDNFLIDFNLYVGLDKWIQGAYFKIHTPFVHTRWALHMCEIIENQGANNHWPGYFSETVSVSGTSTVGITRNNLACSFTSFISGCDFIKDRNISSTPLCYAKINCCSHKKVAMSDVQMALGYNIFCNDDYHVGINLRVCAPTGNSPKAEYLFEPIVGNGGHWEAGVGFSAHVVLGCNTHETKRWEFYVDANLTHMFKAKQCRTFDLCCNPLSRYMLAAKFGPDVEDLQAADDDGSVAPDNPEVPSHQFLGIYTPLANLTTLPVNVTVGFQADLVLMIQHVRGNWSFDLGYNFWGRTHEDIKICGDCCAFEEGVWGLKGDAFMYGFKQNMDGSISTTSPVPLSATQSAATIYQGENNWPNGIEGFVWEQNPGIDNKKLAWDDADSPLLIMDMATSATHHIFTSLDPVLIGFCDLDIYGARRQAISNKVFVHVDYTWRESKPFIPYIGLGGEIEFGYHTDDESCGLPCGPCSSCGACCGSCICSPCMPCGDRNTSCCKYNALSQWGIWFKGGFAF